MKHRLSTIIFIAALGAGPVHAQSVGDAALGQAVFKKCMACHAIGENAKNRVGPVLNDVVGRQAGTYEGFKYSKPMVDAGTSGLMWTPDDLSQFLKSPNAKVPGTKMTFAGLSSEVERLNLIAYLATLTTP